MVLFGNLDLDLDLDFKLKDFKSRDFKSIDFRSYFKSKHFIDLKSLGIYQIQIFDHF